MALNTPVAVFGGAAEEDLLLDLFPGAYVAASVRKLSKNYTGPCVRARKVTGAEQDIGFDSNGILDAAALAAFANGEQVTARFWYDQSGNGYDFGRSGASSNPPRRLVLTDSGGNVYYKNGLPSLYSNRATMYFNDSSAGLPNTPNSHTLFFAHTLPTETFKYMISGTDNSSIYTSVGVPAIITRYNNNEPIEQFYNPNINNQFQLERNPIAFASDNPSQTVYNLINVRRNASTPIVRNYFNNQVKSTETEITGTLLGDFLSIGSSNSNTTSRPIFFCGEFLLWPSELSATDLSDINTNINDSFGIYT